LGYVPENSGILHRRARVATGTVKRSVPVNLLPIDAPVGIEFGGEFRCHVAICGLHYSDVRVGEPVALWHASEGRNERVEGDSRGIEKRRLSTAVLGDKHSKSRVPVNRALGEAAKVSQHEAVKSQ
jgi:hypothetical protein